MIDENLVTVVNSENPVINVEITAQNNKIDIEFVQSTDAIISVHNNDEDAHSSVLSLIKHDINQDISTINTRLISIYTKEESDDLFEGKLNVSDSTITKQGNTFNQADKLVLLNSSAQLPALDASLLKNVTGGGVNKFEKKGTVTSAITLNENIITTAAFSGSVTITLPTITNTAQQVTCVLDFTTVSSAYPSILNTNLKWSAKNGGKAPSAYSIRSGVRNLLIFKSIWVNSTLYWEVEYNTYGGVETTFIQPALSENGTMGGSAFAVTADNFYSGFPTWQGFDNNTSNVTVLNTNLGSFTVYNPIALKLTSISIMNAAEVNSITGYTLYGSNDGSNYTSIISGTNTVISVGTIWTIPLSMTDFYKYFKLTVTSTVSSKAGFDEMVLNGVYIAT